ncbi:hypothetical protein [Rhizohabitans arisaemae]|uniref:hypothetical protein n=1 Tax=Rhizohabitans arisaemae TaxID=2720610 RepID=UPI0024B0A523|nr:hypothetical protein [Rhizohabitans arisaemae]
MPCYRCGARQTDPARGASPWTRGVRHESQVLVCPQCQRIHDWQAELDRCENCDETALVCRLGEVECRRCGHVRAARRTEAESGPEESPELTQEVAAALNRVLGRLTSRG